MRIYYRIEIFVRGTALKKFFNEHRDVLMLILRCAVAAALLIIAVVNYDKLTKIDMRALVAGAGSTAAAVAVIIGVFAVKSVLFIIPASMIYIYVGMAFPTASAIAINLAGIALEITVTYLLGWFLGGEYVEKRLKGSKAGDKVLALGDGKKLSALFLVRFLPVFPIDFVSLFLGATKLPYWKYALISLGGIMPRVILFTILGDGIYDYIPMDKIVLVIVCCIPAVIVWWVLKFFRSKKNNSSAGLAESSLAALRLVKAVDFDGLSRNDRREHELSYSLAGLYSIILTRSVNESHAYLAAVVAVDDSDSVRE